MIQDESNVVTALIAHRKFLAEQTRYCVFICVIGVMKGAIYTGTLTFIARLENISCDGFGHGRNLTCRRLILFEAGRQKMCPMSLRSVTYRDSWHIRQCRLGIGT
jgi:hypothetical protein